jgi:hypothetical protein
VPLAPSQGNRIFDGVLPAFMTVLKNDFVPYRFNPYALVTLDTKKIKLQARLKSIVDIHNGSHVALIDLKAQRRFETLIRLIETCKKHNQIDVCKRYVDEFQVNPYLDIPDFV